MMDITVSKEELQERLANILSVVDKKTTMPILGHILLTVGENNSISATDLETAIKEPVIVNEVRAGGELCVPARKLYEIVKEVDGDLNIQTEGTEWIKIRAGKSNFRLACLNPEDFPKWPQIDEVLTVEINALTLFEMIEKTIYSAGESDTRYTLNSILFHIKTEDDIFTVVGTDGHRLSTIYHRLDKEKREKESNNQDIRVIVPRKSASELRKFLSNEDRAIEIKIAKNHLAFTVGEIQFLVRLIEGNYPKYEQVIPLDNEKKIIVNRADFIKALRRVSVISRDRSSAVKIDISASILKVTASNPELGEASDEVIIDYKGDPISLSLNARYLLDILNAMKTDNAVFELQEPLSPALFKEEGLENYRCVVMPMRS